MVSISTSKFWIVSDSITVDGGPIAIWPLFIPSTVPCQPGIIKSPFSKAELTIVEVTPSEGTKGVFFSLSATNSIPMRTLSSGFVWRLVILEKVSFFKYGFFLQSASRNKDHVFRIILQSELNGARNDRNRRNPDQKRCVGDDRTDPIPMNAVGGRYHENLYIDLSRAIPSKLQKLPETNLSSIRPKKKGSNSRWVFEPLI